MAEPIPLGSPLWSDLEAAFSVDKALEALRAIVAARQLGARWAELQVQVQHQGSVYSATGATVLDLPT